MVTMIIDHLGAAILLPVLNSGRLDAFDYSLAYTAYTVFRLIGRIAFPIFCFLLVEGFYRTSNKRRYAMRLGIFAMISEIPFNLAISQQYFDMAYQNVFFTLLLGLLAIWLASIINNRWLSAIPIIALAFAAEWLHTDYGLFGVILIGVLYINREHRLLQTLVGAALVLWEVTAPISFVLTYFYNGLRGRYNAKWLYWIYPLHLLLFGLIARYFII
jgi:hypothetical protein